MDASLCFEEIEQEEALRVKLTIGRDGRLKRSRLATEDRELKAKSPCLARILGKQRFPKIASRQFQTVSIVVTFQADRPNQWLSERR